MDRFTRMTVIGSAILLVLLGLSLIPGGEFQWRPRIWQLNDVLKDDPALAAYPYPFRVLAYHDGIATLSQPHGELVPMNEFLGVLDPALAGKPDTDPDLVAARELYRRHEARAVELLEALPDVVSVVWHLDRAWLYERGIDPPDPASQPAG